MCCTCWLVGLLALPLQVPPPDVVEDLSRQLETARHAIIEQEAAALTGLADQLARDGDPDSARAVRARLPRPSTPDGATRFVPLPDVVAPRPASGPRRSGARIEEILERSAADLFDLARRAAKSAPPRYAMAGTCLRDVVEHAPDHPEARRLLGYVPYKKGWARPFAVQQFEKGYIDHPVFGWVKADWQPHLERGELPSPPSGGKVRWLPTADADRLRAGWDPPWQIFTEHFQIKTNVPLAEAISFGRRLEAFHDLFMALMADVQGDYSPLARRFRDPKLVGEPQTRQHEVRYFASKEGYVNFLTPKYGQDMDQTLGFYDPPKSSTGRSPAYFFRDPDGDLPVTANLYHEVSHQLLFETAGPNHYTRNTGNYWVFEGLGTYFETVEPQSDGSLEVGGRVGRRMEEAIRSLVDLNLTIPLREFVGFDEANFRHKDREIYLRYQQAMALTVFLMQGRGGAYREGFLDYVREAYRGRIRGNTGRKLDDRLGETYPILEAQFLSFLKDARPQTPAPKLADKPKPVDKPKPADKPKPNPGGAIRTVPRE
jgi:Protein of unknown function (DUF1570)